jgi:FlaA1/EpsC-like NDP-sugar epimerase
MAFAQDGLQYQAILITGGFGAIGKVVVQKLLAHSAPFPRRIGSDFPGRQSA